MPSSPVTTQVRNHNNKHQEDSQSLQILWEWSFFLLSSWADRRVDRCGWELRFPSPLGLICGQLMKIALAAKRSDANRQWAVTNHQRFYLMFYHRTVITECNFMLFQHKFPKLCPLLKNVSFWGKSFPLWLMLKSALHADIVYSVLIFNQLYHL